MASQLKEPSIQGKSEELHGDEEGKQEPIQHYQQLKYLFKYSATRKIKMAINLYKDQLIITNIDPGSLFYGFLKLGDTIESINDIVVQHPFEIHNIIEKSIVTSKKVSFTVQRPFTEAAVQRTIELLIEIRHREIIKAFKNVKNYYGFLKEADLKFLLDEHGKYLFCFANFGRGFKLYICLLTMDENGIPTTIKVPVEFKKDYYRVKSYCFKSLNELILFFQQKNVNLIRKDDSTRIRIEAAPGLLNIIQQDGRISNGYKITQVNHKAEKNVLQRVKELFGDEKDIVLKIQSDKPSVYMASDVQEIGMIQTAKMSKSGENKVIGIYNKNSKYENTYKHVSIKGETIVPIGIDATRNTLVKVPKPIRPLSSSQLSSSSANGSAISSNAVSPNGKNHQNIATEREKKISHRKCFKLQKHASSSSAASSSQLSSSSANGSAISSNAVSPSGNVGAAPVPITTPSQPPVGSPVAITAKLPSPKFLRGINKHFPELKSNQEELPPEREKLVTSREDLMKKELPPFSSTNGSAIPSNAVSPNGNVGATPVPITTPSQPPVGSPVATTAKLPSASSTFGISPRPPGLKSNQEELPPEREKLVTRREGFLYNLVTIDHQKGCKFDLGIKHYQNKVIVSRVDDGPLSAKSLIAGDRIIDINGVPVSDKDVARDLLLKSLQKTRKVSLVVERACSDKAIALANAALLASEQQPSSVAMASDVRDIIARQKEEMSKPGAGASEDTTQ